MEKTLRYRMLLQEKDEPDKAYWMQPTDYEMSEDYQTLNDFYLGCPFMALALDALRLPRSVSCISNLLEGDLYDEDLLQQQVPRPPNSYRLYGYDAAWMSWAPSGSTAVLRLILPASSMKLWLANFHSGGAEDTTSHGWLCNLTRGEAICLEGYKKRHGNKDFLLCPLPLLTAVGNHRQIAGRYEGTNMELVGSWAGDTLEYCDDEREAAALDLETVDPAFEIWEGD